ncbi:LytR/AlgR family response regulator transcription factor [Dinghuibacter silviterrae]|uniref:LytTR family two component transcriptional regulator n=1 Tax=Dinghuibacter silviterrae TaxID=1539049 RepID=A0A4R8DTQ8_9BACT|nr:LytTR family DNA-binding domain-containing protein [Dinghuibacter silviterrae]TDX01712.1 LytTR family two component transcriptional regulator [Dinghuibacter silviterrae]
MKIIIIEDEPMSAEDLAETLKQADPAVVIAKILHSMEDAVAWWPVDLEADLIFSDIQLSDGLSFDIFRQIRHIKQPVVFCTAFDAYAIDAFRHNGIDYILKPFDTASVRRALDRYRQWSRHFSPVTDYGRLAELLEQRPRSVLVYYRDKVLPIRLDDVALFYIDSDTVRLIKNDGVAYAIDHTLDQLEKLGGRMFFRANRQYLVNRSAVKGAFQSFPRRYELELSVPFDEPIVVAKTRVSALLDWLTL